MTHQWLHLDLAAPLMSFGGVAIDEVGPTREIPAVSALTGLFANALGWEWTDREAHQALQERLIFAAGIQSPGVVVIDNQNADLSKDKIGWTTFGRPEERGGGSLDNVHRRVRHYRADARVRVVCSLQSADEKPTTNDLAHALEHPARPLFIGRKNCLPSRPLFAGWIEADSAYQALQQAIQATGIEACKALWPDGEGPPGERQEMLSDIRDWHTGLHSGSRLVHHGRVAADMPPENQA